MKHLRNIFLAILTVTSISCNTDEKQSEQKPDKYVVSYQKDSKTVNDTIAIKDTTLQSELQRMMTEPDYKPSLLGNDTIFNSQGSPTLVKLADDIFGASIQKFEYDNSNRLIRITGYDKQDIIQPFYHDIAIQINKYDQNSNLIEIRNLGKDGFLISSKFEDTPIIRMVYNGKKQLTEEWFLDEHEKLRSEYSIFKYEYDGNGMQVSKGWFNKEGKKE